MKYYFAPFFTLLLAVLVQATPSLAQKVDLTNELNKSKLSVAKDTTYRKIEFGANLNQGSFSTNWTGGGVNAVALGLFFNALSLNKKGVHSWRNDFQSQYGIVKNRGQESRKNVDKIYFDTKYNRELNSKWSLFANFNFLSQFGKGYEYITPVDSVEYRNHVSGLFSPAYLTEAIGIEYKPVSYFFVDFAPAALRQTIVLDDDIKKSVPTNYGVPYDKKLRNEVGIIQLVANFDKDIAKDVNLKFRYLVYTSYSKNSITDKREFNGDHRLDASINAKIAKYFNVNLSAIVVYDKDQASKVQFAQGLGVGFLYQIK
ncbi:Protein of unknown function (DUF3078) [Dyadobacter jejuensis]|uniref:DUF3078 family protein n=1 Tax=Dyadobacter jejuensis TaxID=1082580 RepID=A0A316AS07_9BACT|nr:DUF3078 domain-containing protein [Dyadobacter jejuensis]PWJ60136.1 Protein of unknown function (DUF3078) [Dyadobacter jejuensis]